MAPRAPVLTASVWWFLNSKTRHAAETENRVFNTDGGHGSTVLKYLVPWSWSLSLFFNRGYYGFDEQPVATTQAALC